MKKNKFTVEGIHCGSCVSKIEKGLGNIEGLLSVSVSRDEGEVVTECEDTVTPMTVKAEIEELGFSVISFSKL